MFALMEANGFLQLRGKYINESNAFDRNITGLIPVQRINPCRRSERASLTPPSLLPMRSPWARPQTPNCSSAAAQWRTEISFQVWVCVTVWGWTGPSWKREYCTQWSFPVSLPLPFCFKKKCKWLAKIVYIICSWIDKEGKRASMVLLVVRVLCHLGFLLSLDSFLTLHPHTTYHVSHMSPY